MTSRIFVLVEFYMYDWLVCFRVHLLWFHVYVRLHGQSNVSMGTYVSMFLILNLYEGLSVWRLFRSEAMPIFDIMLQTTDYSTLLCDLVRTFLTYSAKAYYMWSVFENVPYPHIFISHANLYKGFLFECAPMKIETTAFCKAYRLKIWGWKACLALKLAPRDTLSKECMKEMCSNFPRFFMFP